MSGRDAALQARFTAWWEGRDIGRPLMKVIARRETATAELYPETPFTTPEAFHLNVEENVRRYRNFMHTHEFLCDAYPNFDLNIGPGSLAVYLGSEPVFAWDTIWYHECASDLSSMRLKYDPNNRWWVRHLSLIREAVRLSGGDFAVNIPDLIENIDILAAMRGPQNFCYDLMDEPELAEQLVAQVDDLYRVYYDAMHEAIRLPDGGSSYTAFSIRGPGRTAKVQCDFCAMLSPEQFRRFVQPSLRRQCDWLDHSMYHLDGPDAVRHLPALLEIENLCALQWTPGAGQPDDANEKWYPIFDAARAAGKSLWIRLSDGSFDDWIRGASRLVARYGCAGLYLLFPVMSRREANSLMEIADREWK